MLYVAPTCTCPRFHQRFGASRKRILPVLPLCCYMFLLVPSAQRGLNHSYVHTFFAEFLFPNTCITFKALPLQAWSGPESSMKLRFPDFMTTAQDGGKVCQPYAPAAFTPRICSWYSFLLEAESTPGP